MVHLLKNIIKNRELIWALALKDLRIRYKRSILGFLWALLNPLLLMIVLTVVFSTVMRFPIEDYAVFLISALVPWTFFSQALSYSTESIVSNGELLKKINIDKEIFPVSAILANLINFFISLIPLLLLLLALGFPIHITWAYIPVALLAMATFTLGVGFFCSTVNVFFRDVSHIIQVLLTALFYFCPIIYSLDFIPAQYHMYFRLNPMLYILNGFRLSIYNGMLPSIQSIALSLACGLAALLLGYRIFRKYQDTFVFYL